ncbi:MAG: molecular chaperone HtpG [Bacteriovoracaceae bacterium]|nr:molecular chaperone HtpG [Bacteriovoracaceae bacterium]
MSERKGQIKVNTSDMFPIIKKWLYSEHDIFLRELVANATDAITKRASLARGLNTELPTGKIQVVVSKANKTIEIRDNGLGMTEAEVEKYLAQLAFSGAEEFVKKLKESGEDKLDIIGKFGLGFYSAFMVAGKVEVETLSMTEGATPTLWTCEGDIDYTFGESSKSEVGTTIRLYLNEDGEEFLASNKVNETLKNFCDFMPHEIYLLDEEKQLEAEKKIEEESAKELKDEEKTTPYQAQKVNDIVPLWKQDPKELKDEDYINFFKKMYPGEQEPLFWIHLKVDHPFTLDGILYFPKLDLRRPTNESNIRLYCKQVFVSSNVKDVIPEFLSLLKGAIDSHDIPLNVSRSSLQGDPNVRRISNYVVKKVAEALKSLAKKDREKYEAIWEHIGLFIKYGVISDTKFDDLMREKVIFKNSEGKYTTLAEYKESIPEQHAEKLDGKIIYFEQNKSDNSLREHLLEEGVQTIEVEDHIDPHFMQHVEFNMKGDSGHKFSSVDSEIGNIFKEESTSADDVKIKDLFKKVLVGEEKEGEEKDPMKTLTGMDVEIGKIKNGKAPAYIKIDESAKRMQNMMKSMGQDNSFPLKKTLVVNPSNPLIQNAFKISEKGDNAPLVEKICHYVEDLAYISSEGLKVEDKDKFVARSQELMSELTKFAL